MISVTAAAGGVLLVLLAAVLQVGWAGWAGAWLLGAAYAAALGSGDGGVGPWAPAVAVGLYLVVEACDLAGAPGSERTVTSARLRHVVLIGSISAVVASILLIAGAASAPSGLVPIVVSALCGILVLWGVVAALALRRSQ